ncbi:SHOCT domain-containing protein [Nocardia sp. FBN12]|uniref:SHOCT domain-containing protein n=1 Tax=Nocardia sp. FBN12 TaxID=3419766 RepID=UPI003D08A151
MSLLKTAARAAVASSVHGRVQRRQQARWATSHPAPQPVEPAPAPVPASTPSQPAAPTDFDATLAQLERLGQLRTDGVLTGAEFEVQKARILRG